MKVFVSERANRDLLSIYSYVWQRNPTAVDALLQRIDEKFQQLSQLPFIGRERSSLLRGFAA
jgi:plasmid stabilization system protein ParE